mmetsp:Transcript_74113/g.205976  ORF Transcript_74113/g.205976 Transcript_74113/m.205976 type:complete len:290 (-) Transcript_74113:618-1487(-)
MQASRRIGPGPPVRASIRALSRARWSASKDARFKSKPSRRRQTSPCDVHLQCRHLRGTPVTRQSLMPYGAKDQRQRQEGRAQHQRRQDDGGRSRSEPGGRSPRRGLGSLLGGSLRPALDLEIGLQLALGRLEVSVEVAAPGIDLHEGLQSESICRRNTNLLTELTIGLRRDGTRPRRPLDLVTLLVVQAPVSVLVERGEDNGDLVDGRQIRIERADLHGPLAQACRLSAPSISAEGSLDPHSGLLPHFLHMAEEPSADGALDASSRKLLGLGRASGRCVDVEDGHTGRC